MIAKLEEAWEALAKQVPALVLFVVTVVILARIQNEFLDSMVTAWAMRSDARREKMAREIQLMSDRIERQMERRAEDKAQLFTLMADTNEALGAVAELLRRIDEDVYEATFPKRKPQGAEP